MINKRRYSLLDRGIMQLQTGLSTVFANAQETRPNPAAGLDEPKMTAEEARQSAALMRVNHTGEVCAQALYHGQMLLARSDKVRDTLQKAADEETDHLAWTHQRLNELGAHRSYLNGYWYLHSFLLGIIAGLAGDRLSLGFVEETERQVSDHLASHLGRLPNEDIKSRTIVKQMNDDEQRHGRSAVDMGASSLPGMIKKLMTLNAKVMTTLTYWI